MTRRRASALSAACSDHWAISAPNECEATTACPPRSAVDSVVPVRVRLSGWYTPAAQSSRAKPITARYCSVSKSLVSLPLLSSAQLFGTPKTMSNGFWLASPKNDDDAPAAARPNWFCCAFVSVTRYFLKSSADVGGARPALSARSWRTRNAFKKGARGTGTAYTAPLTTVSAQHGVGIFARFE